MIDYGRQMDLEDLAKAIKNAKSVSERERYERLMYRVVNQSTTISSLRNELIAAIRVKDVNKVKRLQLHIQRVRLEETNGRSWGSDKNEGKFV